MGRTKKRLLPSVLIFALIFSMFGVVYAQAAPNASQTVNLSATIDPTTTISVSTNSISFGNINPLTANYSSNLTVTVQSNSAYNLKVYATDDFKTADTTPKVFSITHLGVKLSTDGSYKTMSKDVNNQVALASSQPATASQGFTVNLQLSSDWLNAVPGSYTTSLVFTVSQI